MIPGKNPRNKVERLVKVKGKNIELDKRKGFILKILKETSYKYLEECTKAPPPPYREMLNERELGQL